MVISLPKQDSRRGTWSAAYIFSHSPLDITVLDLDGLKTLEMYIWILLGVSYDDHCIKTLLKVWFLKLFIFIFLVKYSAEHILNLHESV